MPACPDCGAEHWRWADETREELLIRLSMATRDILKGYSSAGIGKTPDGVTVAIIPPMVDRWLACPGVHGELLGVLNDRRQLIPLLFGEPAVIRRARGRWRRQRITLKTTAMDPVRQAVISRSAGSRRHVPCAQYRAQRKAQSAANAARIIELWQRGITSTSKVAADLGLSPGYVRQIIREARATGIPLTRTRNGPEIVGRVVDLRRAGLQRHAIAARTGLSEWQVSRYLQRARAQGEQLPRRIGLRKVSIDGMAP